MVKQKPLVTLTSDSHPFNGLFSRTTWVNQHQKGQASLDFNERRDNEGGIGITWIIYKVIWTSFQTDNHASTSTLSFLQAG